MALNANVAHGYCSSSPRRFHCRKLVNTSGNSRVLHLEALSSSFDLENLWHSQRRFRWVRRANGRVFYEFTKMIFLNILLAKVSVISLQVREQEMLI